jgi:phenylpropionate dioxygenase-like ring-hydroxylating dioxygenase large terminal subunit
MHKVTMNTDEIAALLDDRPDEGIFRVHRRAYEDEQIFELEMKHLFESGWVFLGLANQLPNPHDYLTTHVGRTPVIVMRNAKGELNCFTNTCTHKRAKLCHTRTGNAPVHVCQYHSWSFDSSGRNRAVKFMAKGAYPEAFKDCDRDLARLPAFDQYRGLMFASLNPDVEPLADYLGDACRLLDVALDQGPDGIELVPGPVRWTFEGNWKFQLDNCTDGYHFGSVHPVYLKLLDQRAADPNDARGFKAVWQDNALWDVERAKGSFSFRNGHCAVWSSHTNSENHVLAAQRQELEQRLGAERAAWNFRTRNLTIFPNMQIAENASSQLRIIRPLSARRTEMLTFCFGPVGEARAQRKYRIRQYEDFFNPSGLATPDDAVLYEDCQDGSIAAQPQWQLGYMRGTALSTATPNRFAEQLGMRPAANVEADNETFDESLMREAYRTWHRALLDGVKGGGQ